MIHNNYTLPSKTIRLVGVISIAIGEKGLDWFVYWFQNITVLNLLLKQILVSGLPVHHTRDPGLIPCSAGLNFILIFIYLFLSREFLSFHCYIRYWIYLLITLTVMFVLQILLFFLCLQQCQSLSEVTNGEITYIVPDIGYEYTPPPYYQTTIAKFTCDLGYTVNGVDSITCNDNGEWSGQEPVCLIIGLYI